MLLSEAKRILKRNGYKLIKEEIDYDAWLIHSADPYGDYDGPEDDAIIERADKIFMEDYHLTGEELKEILNKKYPDVDVVLENSKDMEFEIYDGFDCRGKFQIQIGIKVDKEIADKFFQRDGKEHVDVENKINSHFDEMVDYLIEEFKLDKNEMEYVDIEDDETIDDIIYGIINWYVRIDTESSFEPDPPDYY